MNMVRMLAVVLIPLSALTANFAQALGLGELTLNSSLNEPLNAEIKLLNAGSLSEGEILANLASRDDFSKAGVERVIFLSDINFNVDYRDDGTTMIRLSTNSSVKEPFLNFLVEVNWPNGRLLREYTVLLDPPVFSDDTLIADAQAPDPTAVNPDELVDILPEPVAVAEPAPQQTPKPLPESGDALLDELGISSELQDITVAANGNQARTYRVKENDTLWEIAAQNRPNRSLSTQQTMLAIQDLNPEAFINNNINRLKRNKVLRLPDEGEITSRSKGDAVQEVARQNQVVSQNNNPAQLAQLDGTNREVLDSGISADAPDGELKLVSPNAQDQLSASSAAGDPDRNETGQQTLANLQQSLLLNQENLDKAERENSELRERLSDLEAQIETLQSLVSLKDNQMAALQSALADANNAGSNTVAQNDQNFNNQAQTNPAQTQAEIQDVTEPDPFRSANNNSGSLLDSLLQDPRLLGGIAAAILVVLGMLVLLSRRSAQNEKAYQQSLMDEMGDGDDFSLRANNNQDDSDSISLGGGAIDLGAETVFQTAAAPEETAANISEEPNHPINEADIFVAYGRYDKAIDVLSSAIDREPSRSDLRMKILEVFGRTKDKSGFDEHERVLMTLGDHDAIQRAANIKKNVFGPDDQMGAGVPVGGAAAAFVSPNASQAPVADDPMDLDISISDLEQPGAPAAEAFASPEPELPAQDMSTQDVSELDAGMDFNINPSEDATLVADERPSNVSPAQQGSDIELDLADLNGQESSVAEDEIELSLDDFDAVLEQHAKKGSDQDAPSQGHDLELDLGDGIDQDAGVDSPSLDLVDSPVVPPAASPEAINTGAIPAAASFSSNAAAAQGPQSVEPKSSSTSLDDISLDDFDMDFDISLDDDLLSLEDSPANTGIEPNGPARKPQPVLSAVETPPRPSAKDTMGVTNGAGNNAFDDELDGEFDFLAGTDEAATKLDLARAYIDMDDRDGARDILDEVAREGNDEQKREAAELLRRIA